MKCMFLSPSRYSVTSALNIGLKGNNLDVHLVDYEDFFNSYVNGLVISTESLPYRIKNIWKKSYLKKINAQYFDMYQRIQPELVVVYNNQSIDPSVLRQFKKYSKILFVLGDNPLYSPTNIYNIHILFLADYIICPDTFWRDQLRSMGIKNAEFDCFGIDTVNYFKYTPSEDQMKLYSSDLVYVGNAHKNNWGYKRFLFLNLFRNFNLKAFISGDGYLNRWQELFPDLESHIIPHGRYDHKFNNLVYNCSKIYPVETVPALFNGIHIRVFEALGAEILPICEYTSDLDIVFGDMGIPVIRSYHEAAEIADYYIRNEVMRLEMIRKMRERVHGNYSSKTVVGRALSALFR